MELETLLIIQPIINLFMAFMAGFILGMLTVHIVLDN